MTPTRPLVPALDGIACFPITPMSRSGEIDDKRLRDHLQLQLSYKPSAVFSACGTGEYHALSPDECGLIARIAVEEAGGAVPVIAAVGQSVAAAADLAPRLRDAGVNGLLVLPPYLVEGQGQGLVRYYEQISDSTDLEMIIYQRSNATLDPTTARLVANLDSVVAFKDGLGDLELIQHLQRAVGDDVAFLNGTSTAEFLAPAYWALGVKSYSSAVFNFVPELSVRFYDALASGNGAMILRITQAFFEPLVALRREVPGYAVSLIKAGVNIRYGDAGEPRPPINSVAPEHLNRLTRLIDIAVEMAGEPV